MAGKPIAQTQRPQEDLARWHVEYNTWMMSGNNNDLRKEWEQIMEALGRQYGKKFALFEAAQKEVSQRPKFKAFCKRLDELGEDYRKLVRLCRITEPEPDTSWTWKYMFDDSIAPKGGRPGHKYHIPGRIKHFQEGPGVKKKPRRD